MRLILICLVAVFALATLPARAGSEPPQTYDLLFKTGTLDDLPEGNALVYSRDVVNRLKPETEERDTGLIELAFAEGEPPQARLKFTQGDKYRNLGQFPARVGNPIILYFVETAIRDMAETAGGSPFYIRNRVKESLVKPGTAEDGTIDFEGTSVISHAVTLSPFEGDPNAGQMNGFGDLRLEVTMSEDVPGWYHTLRAYVPDPGGATPIYSSTLTFETTKALP